MIGRGMSRRLIWVAVLGGCGFSVQGGTASDARPSTNDAPHAIDALGDDPCRAVEVSASSAHSCARMENGDVWCWGKNDQLEVGRPQQVANCTAGAACNPTPEKVEVPAATGLALGDQHAFVLTANGVYGMGAGDAGQFGDDGGDRMTPALVGALTGSQQVIGGNAHSCWLVGGQVRCSGENNDGELGDGSTTARTMPVIAIQADIDAIGGGFQHACAIGGGVIRCWGENGGDQVDEMGGDVTTPRTIANITTATQVTGGEKHTCALLADGALRCWGANNAGQLGDGTTGDPNGPVTPLIASVAQIVAGTDHTCARRTDGGVWCWGENLGTSPAQITLPRPAVHIAAGSYHDCFALDDGSVWCRGWNAYGQRGLGTLGDQTMEPPTQVRLCPAP